jgi:hypothetical protein
VPATVDREMGDRAFGDVMTSLATEGDTRVSEPAIVGPVDTVMKRGPTPAEPPLPVTGTAGRGIRKGQLPAQRFNRVALVVSLANEIWNNGNIFKLENLFGRFLQVMRDR